MAEATFNSKDLEGAGSKHVPHSGEAVSEGGQTIPPKRGEQRGRYPTKKDPGCHQKEDGNLIRGIKRGSVYQYKGSYQVRVKNNAPHAHLIEYGHVLWVNGTQTEKFVPGKYPLKKAAPEIAATLTGDVDGFVDDLISKGFGL